MESNDTLRYSRQIAIENIGKDGQDKLRTSRVTIVGCGALGSMAAMQLAGAGIGKIRIADFDTIDISNLQRQFFFKSEEAGKNKAEILKERIISLNENVQVDIFPRMVTKNNIKDIFTDTDFVIDATDNPSSKYLIESICEVMSIPCCIGGVSEFHAQVTTILPGGIKFKDLFPDPESGGFAPCSVGGVIGPVAVVCASLQAAEAMKYILNVGELLDGKLLRFDLLTNQYQLFAF